jgi:hypothetical protein
MGGFIRKILGVQEPTFQQPSEVEVPDYEDEERKLEERRKLLEIEKKRKGRRSTILTDSKLGDIEEENLKKTILGG